jgi:signal transduction histidine kinase
LSLRAEFLSDLFVSIEADRRQIAHDLHDGVGQSLTLLFSGLRSTLPAISDPVLNQRSMELKQFAKQALIDVKRLA